MLRFFIKKQQQTENFGLAVFDLNFDRNHTATATATATASINRNRISGSRLSQEPEGRVMGFSTKGRSAIVQANMPPRTAVRALCAQLRRRFHYSEVYF